jgi:hypothetical protein
MYVRWPAPSFREVLILRSVYPQLARCPAKNNEQLKVAYLRCVPRGPECRDKYTSCHRTPSETGIALDRLERVLHYDGI